MAQTNEGYRPTDQEVEDANNILLSHFLYSDQMQNLSGHGRVHVAEVRIVAYHEDQGDQPCLELRLPGVVVKRDNE